MWQNWVFAIGQWVFSVALLPSIFGSAVFPKATSAMTAGVLTAFVVCFFTLDNFSLSAWSTMTTAACWWTLLIKAIIKERGC